jgi:hypothetical protein
MTNPTTPFSWQMPTSTDLVTDLPADFEIFGQAVATSMADLLGGTTGQVLSKASNTNMDFTWVTTDDANAIQNSIVDAKGDLIGATANDTPARLAVGANGTMLVANSAESTGLKWTTATDQFPWQAWTPSYSGITVGNGSVVARYQQIGKTVTVFFKLTFGTTTSVSNYGTFSQPVTASQAGFMNGTASFIDNGASIYGGWIYMESGGVNTYFVANLTNGAYSTFAPANSTGTPTTFGNTDIWIATYTYEAA